MPTVDRPALAKVNLALHVVGRRPDGYHDLDTLAVFADVGECVRVSSAAELTLTLSGPLSAAVPAGADNLVLKAAELLRRHCGYSGGADIRLDKHLPSGAGFGGASADAAATLLALDQLWDLRLGHDKLAALARELGADVPMCLAEHALRARGTGERIALFETWPALPLVLVWPGVPLGTAAVFAALEQRDNSPMPKLPPVSTVKELAAWLDDCRNDLEATALRLLPEVGVVLANLRAQAGCRIARMSGSGSGCFGLFADAQAARTAADRLRAAQSHWWVRAAEAH